jgi:hypothetical protein
MKNKILIIILLLISFPIFIRCENEVVNYKDDSLHYSSKVPTGWERIDTKALNEFVEANQNAANQQLRFDAAFQRISDSWFDYPYFLIQVLIQKKPVSLNQLSEEFKKAKVSNAVSFADVNIDKTRNCIITKSTLSDPDVGNVQGATALFPGKNCMIQIIFRSKQFDQDESDFNFILDNFEFSKGYGYPNAIARFFSNYTFDWGKGIAAGIIALFSAWYAQVKRRKKKPFAPLTDEDYKESQRYLNKK